MGHLGERGKSGGGGTENVVPVGYWEKIRRKVPEKTKKTKKNKSPDRRVISHHSTPPAHEEKNTK